MQNLLKLCTRGDYVIKLLSKYKIIFVLILLSVTGLLLMNQQSNQETIQIIDQVDSASVVSQEESIKDGTQLMDEEVSVPIYLCGAVINPGVYYIEKTAILKDVLEIAGGLIDEADLNQLNLAEPIYAHQKIYIPKIGEQIDKMLSSYENEERTQKSSLININRANESELITLPGIGEVKAQQIILYREQSGFFTSKESIKNVPGIGDKVYEGLQELITIE